MTNRMAAKLNTLIRVWRGPAVLHLAAAAMSLAIVAGLGSMSAHAQGFGWPWETEEPRRAPVPSEPVWREPEPRGGASQQGDSWNPDRAQRPSGRASVCLSLEQRLVKENQNAGSGRDRLPEINNTVRQARRDLRQLERDLERSDCYEWFLFSKQLRNSRACRRMANDMDQTKRRVAELEAQRQDIESTGNQSYQDEIIRELARNNCGASYVQEARRRDRGPFSGLWQDEDSSGSGYGNGGYRSLPFATYRTVCVRLCDGYYFPVSFSTLPNHFDRDAEVCQSKCAAPAQLYYYQNPGGAVNQMVAYSDNQQYTKLKTAFLYRKEYINGCSCKQAEYVPQTPMPEGQKSGAADPAVSPTTTGSTMRNTQANQPFDPWQPR
ncbi:MAG: DUF2865 domain-containing protein [Hyphomicrobiaceae bacterium]